MKKNMTALMVLCLVMFGTTAQAAVLGIDFGSSYFKISLNAPKKQFLIVENQTSNRKTMNAISFYNSERFYDKTAAMKQSRNPETTFVFLDKFLGALENDEETLQIAKKYFEEYALAFDQERGTAIFELKKFALNDPEEILTLSVEEVVGMILHSGKRYAEKMAEIPNIRDCVLTVPVNWSLRQRIALVQAAKIAGLSPLALIHDNTAAALHFGISRLAENATNTVLFYNIGATNTQASLVEYSYMNNTVKSDSQKIIPVITVLADYGMKNVGGYAYDLVLAHYFADDIDNRPDRKGKPSFRTNRKGMVKLLKECNRVKEVLSANKEMSFFSEGLLEGNDYNSHVSRVKFEEASKELLDVVTKPIDIILARANKTIADIDIIELIGGGLRIPRIQSILSEYFNQKELGFHLNGDESMALGAAFQAANYSSAFRVKKIQLNDGYNFDVKLLITDLEPVEELDGEGKPVPAFKKEHTIFPIKTRFNTKKTIALKHSKDLSIEVFASSEEETLKLAQYNVTNITTINSKQTYNSTETPKVHLTFELGSINTIDLIEAYATLNVTQIVEVEQLEPVIPLNVNKTETAEETKEKETEKTEENNSSQESTDNQEKEETEPAIPETDENDQTNNTENEGESQPETQQDEPQPETDIGQDQAESEKPIPNEEPINTNSTVKKVFKTKYRTVEFELDVKEDYPFFKPLNQTQVEASAQTLKRYEAHEEKLKKTAAEKNGLETFIYQIREYLEDEAFVKFSVAAEREKASALAEEHVTWLDGDDSFGAAYEEFKKRLTGLKNSVRPIIRRIEEYNKRPAALNSTMNKLSDYASKVMKLNKTMSWVTDEQKQPITVLLGEIRDWIAEKIQEQEKLELHEDPAFMVQELDNKVAEVKREFEQLKKIKKPKEEKKPEKKDEKKDSKKEKDSKKKDDKSKESNEEDITIEEPSGKSDL